MTGISRLSVNGLLKVGLIELPLSIQIEGCVQGQVVLNPSSIGAEIDAATEAEACLSAIEAEAIGLSPAKACDALNRLCGGFLVSTNRQADADVINALFDLADKEASFSLEPLGLLKVG